MTTHWWKQLGLSASGTRVLGDRASAKHIAELLCDIPWKAQLRLGTRYHRLVAPPPNTAPHRSNIARAIGTTRTSTQPRAGRMFWLWWKTLSGSYVVFTFTSRS